MALVSGLTDTAAITLSSLHFYQHGKLEAAQAITAISLAFISNVGFKLGLVFFIGSRLLARQCVFGLLATAAGLGLGLLFLL